MGLLILTMIVKKENKNIWVQPNLMLNILKEYIIAQSTLIPKGLNSFETPPALIHQLLAQFNTKSSTININRYKISLTDNNLADLDEKDRRSGFIIPSDIDSYLYHMKNFTFLIVYYLSEFLYT